MKNLLLLTVLLSIMLSCENKTGKHEGKHPKENEQTTAKTDKAEEWLKSIFKCKDSNAVWCYYAGREDSICTKRFMDFLIDSEEIYGASDLTEEELPKAEKKYREKWSKIYPLHTEEMWPFGRGNDDPEYIKDLKIKKISELKYSVFIEYESGIKTANEVTLFPAGNSFKIDYCKTKFLN